MQAPAVNRNSNWDGLQACGSCGELFAVLWHQLQTTCAQLDIMGQSPYRRLRPFALLPVTHTCSAELIANFLQYGSQWPPICSAAAPADPVEFLCLNRPQLMEP